MGVTLEPQNKKDMGNPAALMGSLAGPVIGAGIGMATAGWQDKRQLRQNEKLLAQQRKSDLNMMHHQQAMAMKYWEDTNYSSQLKQMEKAGLSPALMYGGSGQGGSLMQPNAGSGSQGVGSGEIMGGIAAAQKAQELSLLNAQKDLLESQADKNKADAEKTRGVDTEEAYKRMEKLGVDIDNVRVKTRLESLQADYQQFLNWVKGKTLDAEIGTIRSEWKKARAEARNAMIYADIQESTKNEQIGIINNEFIGGIIENAYRSKQIDKTDAEINSINEKVRQEWERLGLNEWGLWQEEERLSLEHRKADQRDEELRQSAYGQNVKQFEAVMKANYPSIWNVVGHGIMGALGVTFGSGYKTEYMEGYK